MILIPINSISIVTPVILMTSSGKIVYHSADGQVIWYGLQFEAGDNFKEFMRQDVRSILIDEEEISELDAIDQIASSSNFDNESVRTILISGTPSWAIGEAIAEAYLQNSYNIHWLSNTRKGVRTPNAGLPGPDLVGFIQYENDTKLVFAEVKSSGQQKKPPSVLYGSGGLVQQIIRLAEDRSLKVHLSLWLLRMCKETKYEEAIKLACRAYLNPKFRSFSLYGVLVRDTFPDQTDLKPGGEKLAAQLQDPADCHLIALYLPCKILELTELIGGNLP